jgi:hypothetical protein
VDTKLAGSGVRVDEMSVPDANRMASYGIQRRVLQCGRVHAWNSLTRRWLSWSMMVLATRDCSAQSSGHAGRAECLAVAPAW